MLKKIGAFLALFTACFTAVAFADVPNPYGGPRPRPEIQEVQHMYKIRHEVYPDLTDRPEEVMLKLVMGAPNKSVVKYTLLNEENQVMAEDSSDVESRSVTFQIYIPKPPRNDGCEYRLRLNCCLDIIKTSFGYKFTDKPVYTAQEDYELLVYCDGNRNCRIEFK